MAATREVHFVKFFVSQNSSEKFIPLAFNEYCPDPLPINVELLCFGGRSWTVGMKRRGEKVYLRLGWENFVKDNNLEDGKLLHFTYDCHRTFSVIVFGHNGCSEFIDFPRDVIDVDDYEIREEDDEEENDSY